MAEKCIVPGCDYEGSKRGLKMHMRHHTEDELAAPGGAEEEPEAISVEIQALLKLVHPAVSDCARRHGKGQMSLAELTKRYLDLLDR